MWQGCHCRGPERSSHKVAKMKLGFHWRHQDVGEARIMQHLPSGDADGVELAQERKKHAAVNRAERSWRSKEQFDIRHRGVEFGVCPAVFCPYFFTSSFLLEW